MTGYAGVAARSRESSSLPFLSGLAADCRNSGPRNGQNDSRTTVNSEAQSKLNFRSQSPSAPLPLGPILPGSESGDSTLKSLIQRLLAVGSRVSPGFCPRLESISQTHRASPIVMTAAIPLSSSRPSCWPARVRGWEQNGSLPACPEPMQSASSSTASLLSRSDPVFAGRL
jgi:hypothetical protein